MDSPTHKQEKRMTVWEHLRELRGVLIWCIVFLVIGVGVTAVFAGTVFEVLLGPLENIQGTATLHTFSPAEVVIMYLKISLFGGLLLSSPFLLWFILRFVLPGLKPAERRMILPAGAAGLLLFVLGLIFAYYVVLPVSLKFLWEFNVGFGLTPQWRVNYYLSFVLGLCGVFGLAFELPLLVTLLAQLGIASPAFLRQKRRYVIVGLVIMSALLTPPDVITQLLMTVPLWLLYEFSILMSVLVYPYEH